MTFLTLGGKVRQSEKHSAEATFTVNKRRIPILCKKKRGGCGVEKTVNVKVEIVIKR